MHTIRKDKIMIRRICLSIFACGIFFAGTIQSTAQAHGPGIRVSIGRGGYYNGYGRGYYGGYGQGYNGYGQGYNGYGQSYNGYGQGFNGGYGYGNYGYSSYGNGPYGYGAGNAYQPFSNGGYGNGYGNSDYYNGYGNSGYYGQTYAPVYSPFGFGVYSAFNNGW